MNASEHPAAANNVDASLSARSRNRSFTRQATPHGAYASSLLDLIGTLQELNALGVGFVSLTEALHLTTAGGRERWLECWRSSPSSNATFYAIASKPESRRRAARANPTGARAPCNTTPAKSGPCTGTE